MSFLNNIHYLITLSSVAKQQYHEQMSTVVEKKVEKVLKNPFPKATSKRYAPFNKVGTHFLNLYFYFYHHVKIKSKHIQEQYVQQAIERAKNKVLRPQDVQEYYSNLRQFGSLGSAKL